MALTRNPDNIPIFVDAAVFIGKTATPTVPATITADFGSTWDNLGVLDGDAGISDSREWDETEHFGWGTGLFRIGRKNYKETRGLTCLENNETTWLLAHGASSTSNDIYVNKGIRRPIAIERTDDSGRKERWITTQAADLWIPNLDFNESDPSGKEVTARIFANGAGKLYTRQYTGVTQLVVVTGTGGTFTLSYKGQTTAGITFSATTAAVQTALEGLSTIGTGNVTVTGTPGNYTVTKLEYLLGADGSSLTGGTVTVSAA